MTPAAVGLALLAAAMHAAWNVAVKGSTDRLLNIWAIMVVATALTVPLFVVVGPPPASVLPLLAVSVVIHVAYDVLLASAYDRVDLSVAYPLARGTAPALVAIGGAVWLADVIPATAVVGLIGVCGGLVTLAGGRPDPAGLVVALLAAAMLAAYTIVDTAAVRQVGTLPFVAALFPLHALTETLLVLGLRGPARMRAFLRVSWRRVAVSGVLASGAYVIVLVAVRLAPVGLVSALRETSVVLAALLGALLLDERVPARRWAAVGVIAAGAALLALA